MQLRVIDGEGDGGAESTNSLALAGSYHRVREHKWCNNNLRLTAISHGSVWQNEQNISGTWNPTGQHNAAPVVFSWRNLWRFKSAAEDQSPGDKKKWVMKQAFFFLNTRQQEREIHHLCCVSQVLNQRRRDHICWWLMEHTQRSAPCLVHFLQASLQKWRKIPRFSFGCEGNESPWRKPKQTWSGCSYCEQLSIRQQLESK